MEPSGNVLSGRPLAEEVNYKNDYFLFSVLFKNLSAFVVSLPLFGLAFSVVWSLIFDFERSTGTSCRVSTFNFCFNVQVWNSIYKNIIYMNCLR